MCSTPNSATLLKRYCPKGIVDISAADPKVFSRERILNKTLQAEPNAVEHTKLGGENEGFRYGILGRISRDLTS